jgi:hypothetical protein
MLYDKRWDTKPQTNVAATLNAMADYIDEHGWCRFSYEKEGRVCITGALRSRDGSIWRPVFLYLGEYLGKNPLTWNDVVCKSGAEASAMLREAAQAHSFRDV